MKKIFVLTALVLLAACASTPKVSKTTLDGESPQQGKFDQGIKALDSERYSDAAKIFDAILIAKPGTEMDLVALYDSGAAYEGMGDCQKAADRYRQVVRSSAGKFKRIEGEALFRLSLAYECLGQDAKTITALMDAKRRGKELSFETINAELPARLAAAYSRLGNRTKALEYFNIASKGLKAVLAHGGGGAHQSDLLARTLFVMGKLSPNQKKGEVDADGYLQSISIQQPYLLQAMEIKRAPWSGKAEDDLKTAYQNIWSFRFTESDKKREFYTRGLQTINELKNIRLNKPDPGIDSVFALLEQTESRLQNELAKVAETNALTPEAEKREGLRREGRLVDPKPKKPKAQTTR